MKKLYIIFRLALCLLFTILVILGLKLAFMFFSGLYESIGLTFSSRVVIFESCHITLITHPNHMLVGLNFLNKWILVSASIWHSKNFVHVFMCILKTRSCPKYVGYLEFLSNYMFQKSSKWLFILFEPL